MSADKSLHAAVVQSNRVRERARVAAKVNLALNADHPGVWYRNELDGSFTLGVDANGTMMPGWPAQNNTVKRAALAAAIAAEIALIDKPIGTTSVVRLA